MHSSALGKRGNWCPNTFIKLLRFIPLTIFCCTLSHTLLITQNLTAWLYDSKRPIFKWEIKKHKQKEHCWLLNNVFIIWLLLPESHGKRIRLISLSNQKGSISRNSHQHVFCLSSTQVAIVPTAAKNQNGQRITKPVWCNSVTLTGSVTNNRISNTTRRIMHSIFHTLPSTTASYYKITQQLVLD